MKIKTTMKKKIISCIFFIMLAVVSVQAQRTSIHNSPENIYRKGLELFYKQHFSAAFDRFNSVIEQLDDKESLIYSECLYYMAVCAYELLNNDAEYLLETFINNYHQNARTEMAGFYLANIQFRERKYKKALERYEQIDPEMLSREQLNEYYFRYGYSAFKMEDLDRAISNFIKVKDTDHFFSVFATYYFAHINYTKGNHATALESFKKLIEDKNFGSIVPYYITQILFFQKKYSELIDFAEPFVEKASTKRQPEISRLIGASYFHQKNYAKALFWLERFRTTTSERLSLDDNYKIAYAHYATGGYAKAIPFFQDAIKGNDTMAQNAHYHLGSCYLKTGNKQQARNAFYQAYKIGENKIIKEDAMFHFAKLSYELAINPYNEAIKALLDFINSYPKSHRVNEAYEYLINLFMQTKNYRKALVLIEQIERPSQKLNMAYQRIAYFRGVELFNDRNFREAVATFNKSINFPYDRNIRAQAIFWRGESYFRLDLLDSALISFNSFLKTPGAFGSDLYSKALYNIGYIYFNKKQYDKALTNFRTFQKKHPVNNDALSYDVFIRTGDCFFALKRFAEAEIQYNKAVKPRVASADYALFQRGNSKGVQGNFQGKISDLELFLRTYTRSSYIPDVIYELASTYMIIENYTSAIENFNKIANNFKNSRYHVRSLLRLGMIYNNLGRNEQALTELRKVIQTYPGSDESKEALVLVRNIYTDMDRVEEFFAFVKEHGSSVTASEQDSISYIAAENLYFKGNCSAAIKSFEKYIKNFPNGANILKAHFFKAECEFLAQNWDNALVGYEFVINRPWSRFSEKSLLNTARIYFTKEDYTKSAIYYSSLEEKAEKLDNVLIARQGMMRSYYKDKQYSQSIIAAQKVIDTPKASDESIVEARSIIGISAYKVEDFSLARQMFNEQKMLKSEYGAEAFYYLALINYTLGNFKESEKLIFELINTLPSYEYWIAKSFILLADNYVANESFYQAKHTLLSVIDNYEGADLVQIAKQKMAEIEALENNLTNE